MLSNAIGLSAQLARSRTPIYVVALTRVTLRMTGRHVDGQISYLTIFEFAGGQVRQHLADGAVKAGRVQ